MEAPRSLQGSRRHHRARRLARGLCLGALSLALLGPVAAPGSAATGPGVVFTGATTPIPIEALAPTAPNLTTDEYLVRATPGEAGEPVRRTGMPVATALEKAGVTSFGYLTIPRPNGTTAYLPAAWFLEPQSFEGEHVALFSADGNSVHFLRPLLAAEPDGTNAQDNIATVGGEPMVVGVHQGEVVGLVVSPASTATDAGTPVQLSAAVTGGGAGEGFTYAWSFGDGTTATGSTVSHAFAGSGTYVVRVTATGSGGSGGESGPVNVVVGTPPAAQQPGATAAATKPEAKRRQAAGPNGEGRQGRGGRGSKSGKGGSGDTEHVARQGEPRRRSGRTSHPVGPTTPAAEPAPVVAPPPAPATTTGNEGGPRSGGSTSAADASTRQQPDQPTAAGQLVEGRLVGDDLGPTALDEAAAGATSGQGAPSAAGAVGGGGVPVVALIVVGLLAAGALYEWRRGAATR